jgi:hypothetical protein
VLQPSETDLAFTLPLADLLERGCDFRDLYFQTPRGGRWERVYTYRHGRHLVWGATARMLHALTCIVRGEQS